MFKTRNSGNVRNNNLNNTIIIYVLCILYMLCVVDVMY